MAQIGEDDAFHICARGPQAWESADVAIVNERINITVNPGTSEELFLAFTKIQSQELVKWLIGENLKVIFQ